MMLPTFSYIRNHTHSPGQLVWDLECDGLTFLGYTDDAGLPRDIQVLLPSFSFEVKAVYANS